MSTPKRAFKGVWIPAEIWDCSAISWMEKCLLAEINALDGGDGCWASNEFLAEKFGTTAGNIAKILSSLRSLGFVETIKFDGRTRWLKVNAGITKREDQGLQNGQPCDYESGNPEAAPIIGEKQEEVLGKSSASQKPPKMAVPSLEEVKAQCEQSSGSPEEAEKFWHYYESNGWKVGRNPMKSWKSALEGWLRRNLQSNSKPKSAFSNPVAQKMDLKTKIKLLEEQIASHPANQEFIGASDCPTDAQRADLKRRRADLEASKSQLYDLL